MKQPAVAIAAAFAGGIALGLHPALEPHATSLFFLTALFLGVLVLIFGGLALARMERKLREEIDTLWHGRLRDEPTKALNHGPRMLPLMARDFHRFSSSAPVVNLVAVPMIGVLVQLGFLPLEKPMLTAIRAASSWSV